MKSNQQHSLWTILRKLNSNEKGNENTMSKSKFEGSKTSETKEQNENVF